MNVLNSVATNVTELGTPGPGGRIGGRGEVAGPTYLTTEEAAAYLRRSVSWLLRVRDLPFLRGKPNVYTKADLDGWVERHKVRPKVRV